MSNFVDQSKLNGTKPVIYNVANFTKPAPGQPALLSYDDVITMFHEFGHALHGMFADQEYPSLSGTNTARDFVEFRRSSTSTGSAIRKCSATSPSTTRAARRCRRNWSTRSRRPTSSTRATA